MSWHDGLVMVCFSALVVVVGNEIGPKGGKEIGRSLASNSTLTALNLRSEYIRCDEVCDPEKPAGVVIGNWMGPKVVKEMCRALATNCTLTALNLRSKDLILLRDVR